MGRSDPQQLAYWAAVLDYLPSADPRDPWVAVGGGGTLTNKGVSFVTSSARKGYTRAITRTAQDERIEIQTDFQLTENSPGWASGEPGHVLWIDDGYRALGLAIGSTLSLIDPETGALVFAIPTDDQPGGATTTRGYHLIKDGTATWDVFVDGRLVARFPYSGAPLATYTVATVGFGWQDASGNGNGLWNRVETGIGEILPPHWKVDRYRLSSIPGPIQIVWTQRHEAALRARVGLVHAAHDEMERLVRRFTADVIDVQSYAFIGDVLPSDTTDGWTEQGDTGEISIVRQRLRFDPSANPTYAQRTPTTPTNTDAVYYVSARFTARDLDSEDPAGRIGPFLQILDGAQTCGAFLVRSSGNPDEFGWLISDQAPSSATLGITGETLYRVDPYHESHVELFVIGGTRVILFVNGQLVEDMPYANLNNATATRAFRIGRDGSADISCRVDISDGLASIGHGDEAYRALFSRRVAERLLFSGGCERNDVLDAWIRRRHGVFAARGTDRSIHEIRRLSCDDDAALVVNRYPGMWYLGVTFPMITPTFISANGIIPEVFAEFSANAPNFTAEQLQALIERYILPRSLLEARFIAALVATLTSGTSLVGDHTEFSVDTTNGFAVGDDVTIRGATSGDLLSLTYDSDENLTALSGADVRDFSGNSDHGSLTNSGADATIGNTAYPARDGVVLPVDASAGDMEGILSPALVPVVTSGFTVAGWFRNDIAHDGSDWYLGATDTDTTTKGYEWLWNAAGSISASVYGSLGGKTIASAQAPAAGTWVHYAMRWDASANVLTTWKNGVVLSTSNSTALTVDDPNSATVGFGCDAAGANRWKGQHRDHILFERALSDAEMLELYNESTGRGELRDDADVRLSYLPSGWPATLATFDDDTAPLAADYMEARALLGSVWTEWALVALGAGNGSIGGLLSLPGLDGDRTNTISTGATAQAQGAGATVDVWLELFGIDNATGLPASERIKLDGTTPNATSIEWDELHGIICEPSAQDDITVTDSSDSDLLYTITAGNNSSGCYFFDPPLFAGPSAVAAVADAATTDSILAFGAEEQAQQTGEEIALNGTSAVISATTFDTVRVVTAGYIAAARTITVSALLLNPNGDITFISNDSGDTQGIRVFLVDTEGASLLLSGTMNGTSLVTLSVPAGQSIWRIAGIWLQSAAVGTITVRCTNNASILVNFLTAGQRTLGFDIRNIECIGTVDVRIEGEIPVTDRFAVLIGRDDEGDLIHEAIRPVGSTWATSALDYARLVGVATGHVPTNAGQKAWVRVAGIGWRHPDFRTAALNVEDLHGWAVAGPGVPALDGVLADIAHTDLTLTTVDLQGVYSATEDTSISALNADTGDIETPPLTGSFSSGAKMRRKEPVA